MVITSDPGAKTRSEPANLLSQMLPHDPAAPAGGGQVDRPPSARGCRAHGSEASQRSVLNAGAGTAEGVCGPSHVRRVTQARRALARLPRRPRPWAASARLRSEGRPRGGQGAERQLAQAAGSGRGRGPWRPRGAAVGVAWPAGPAALAPGCPACCAPAERTLRAAPWTAPGTRRALSGTVRWPAGRRGPPA